MANNRFFSTYVDPPHQLDRPAGAIAYARSFFKQFMLAIFVYQAASEATQTLGST
jgi:hypothetical protein